MRDEYSEEVDQVKKWDIEFGLTGENRPAVLDKRIADCNINKFIKNRLLNGLFDLCSGVNFDNPSSFKEEITFDHIRHLDAYFFTSTYLRNWGKKCTDELHRVVEENNALFYNDHYKINSIASLKKSGQAKEFISDNSVAKHFVKNVNTMLHEAQGEVSYIKTIPENIVDLTSDLKTQLEAQGYIVEAQLKITKPEQNTP